MITSKSTVLFSQTYPTYIFPTKQTVKYPDSKIATLQDQPIIKHSCF